MSSCSIILKFATTAQLILWAALTFIVLLVPVRRADAQAAPATASIAPEISGPASTAPAQDTQGSLQQPGAHREVGFRWDDRASLHLGKGTRLDFRARVQADTRRSDMSLADVGQDFEITRRRIGIEGTVAGVVDFEIERELQHDDAWRDVYANYRQFVFVQVQAGKFKLPFSLDENTGAANLDFVYRSLAADALAPGRDRGVMMHGRLLGRRLRYELGMFDHDGRNARTRNPERVFGGRTLAGRTVVQPFRASKTPASELQLGLAFTSSELPLGASTLRGRTALEGDFFDPDLWVQGLRRRAGVEMRWRPGPFSVKAEYIRVTTERREQSVEDTDLSPLLATGWYISGTWALTGERKADGLTVPRRPLLRGGFGAIELALRVEELSFRSEAAGDVPSTSPRADVILGNADRAVTLGVNWYLNRWIKVQVNTIRERITDPARGPLPSQPGFWSQVFRFQFIL